MSDNQSTVPSATATRPSEYLQPTLVHSDGVTYDVVVIGGGAAGLSGAVALARSRRRVLVIDDGQPRNAPAAHVHNFLSRDGTPPHQLLALGRAELERYGGELISCQVSDVETFNSLAGQKSFRVKLVNKATVYARRLLVTSGLVDELPDLPGIRERWGRDVLHCPYCHGWEVRDQAIGILATGPMALHQALLFSQLSRNVVLFEHTATPFLPGQVEELTARGIAIIQGEVVALEVEDDRLRGVRLISGEIIPRQVVVVAPRFVARADFLDKLGVEIRELENGGYSLGSYVASDPTGATNIAGIWVAGNVTDLSAQVISAAAAGLKAGVTINLDLINEDTALSVAELKNGRNE